jgi:hypothetical protein
MRNRDVEELFELVSEGDVVEFHDEKSSELAGIFGGDVMMAKSAPPTLPPGADSGR